MTDIPGLNTIPLHKSRAGEHLSVAETLCSVSAQWSMVVAFYSAFHSMKAAFLEDPVFDDASALAAANVHLSMESRWVGHHQGNTGKGRAPGVVEVVRHLYRPYYARYQQLHGASITVRYGAGDVLTSAEDCLISAREIHDAMTTGELRHG